MKNKISYIGTNFGHSAAACLLNTEGTLIFAVEEERILKEKYTSKFPTSGIQMILEECNVHDEICWSEGWNVYKRLILKGLWHSIRFSTDSQYFKSRFINEFKRFREGQKKYPRYGKFVFVGHHISHAYSLLPYGLPINSLILVSDTIGESESISIYYWNGKMHLIKSIPYPHSLGSVFHQFAYHFGFSGRTAPGKLMALSGFGRPLWEKEISEIGSIQNGEFKIDLSKYPAYRIKDAPDKYITWTPDSEFKNALIACKNNFQHGLDVAATIQKWFTTSTWELICQHISFARNKLKLKVNHIGLAGGAALNCQANGYFLQRIKELNIGSLTVSPWSEDAGTAIGAAVCGYVKNNPGNEISTVNAFLGPMQNFKQCDLKELTQDIDLAAEYIIQGKLISLVSGRMEFGPRALGGRCILASPFIKDLQLTLNKHKARPSFMPFAPAVLEDDFEILFHGKGSNNMAWTVPAKKDAVTIIPAAVHITMEARTQIVTAENQLLFHLLKCIKRKKGLGILLLTSLNGAGETIPIYYREAKEMSKKLNLYGMLSDTGWEKLSFKPIT